MKTYDFEVTVLASRVINVTIEVDENEESLGPRSLLKEAAAKARGQANQELPEYWWIEKTTFT